MMIDNRERKEKMEGYDKKKVAACVSTSKDNRHRRKRVASIFLSGQV
jgi:hypothetical protein